MRRLLGKLGTRQGLFLKLAAFGIVIALFVTVYLGLAAVTQFRQISLSEPLAAVPLIEDNSGRFADATRRVAASDAPALVEPTATKPARTINELVWPVPAIDVVAPGWRRHRELSFWYYESALIMRAPSGSDVIAAGPGIVASVAAAPAGGWEVIIQHDDGVVTTYGNVFDITVARGNAISTRARLGTVRLPAHGDTEDSPALPSISFSARQSGDVLNVLGLLNRN